MKTSDRVGTETEPFTSPPPGIARMRGLRQPLVERPRLLFGLEGTGGTRLTYVQAPAGYGKRSLLQQGARRCVAQGDGVAWVGLEGHDGEPMSFAHRLLHAV